MLPIAAKSYGGGSSRSFSSPSKSYSSSPSSKSSTWSKTTPTTSQTSTRVASNVDSAKYKSAVQSGKAFPTRTAAVNDFKAKNASTYTSKYASEPATRPDHIPQTYKSGGNTYNITYDRSAGGYGYWNGGGPGLGTFLLYDAMSDAIMTDHLMSRSGYYVGAAPVVGHSAGHIFLMCLIVVIILCGIIGILIR